MTRAVRRLRAAVVLGNTAVAQAPAPVRVLLSEVLFDPAVADAAFDELLNAGTTPVDVASRVLHVDGTAVPLPRLAAPLAAGAPIVVRFDGRTTFAGRVIHAPPDVRLDAGAGSISLRSSMPGHRTARQGGWGSRRDDRSSHCAGAPRTMVLSSPIHIMNEPRHGRRFAFALPFSIAMLVLSLALLVAGPRTLLRWFLVVLWAGQCYVYWSLRRSAPPGG